MEFCPRCGSILRPAKGKEGKLVLRCSCGYTTKVDKAEGYKVKFDIQHTERDYIVVVEEDETTRRKKREIDEDERQEMLELVLDHFPED